LLLLIVRIARLPVDVASGRSLVLLLQLRRGEVELQARLCVGERIVVTARVQRLPASDRECLGVSYNQKVCKRGRR